MVEALPYIFKKETKSHPVTGVIEEKQVTVQGKEFADVRKEFDKQWNGGD